MNAWDLGDKVAALEQRVRLLEQALKSVLAALQEVERRAHDHEE